MDIASIFLFCLMSLVIGAVLMLLIQYYAFLRYFNTPPETAEQKNINEKYSLPDDLMNSIKANDPESKYPIVALNLIVQFLFHELKNANMVRKWLYRKLTFELDELISRTITGKLFDKLTIRDFDVGAQFPEIKNLRVHKADLHESQEHIENLDLILDLKYSGNFRLSVDADLVLGKKGSLTVRVKNIEGLARLQFTRKPYTHWSLSFLGDPKLDLDIESQFQGRQMQSNITSLIISQIRKAVRRKHTLPNYRLRFKPFFHKVEEEYDCDILPNGKVDIKISELSRLQIPDHISEIYCTLTMSSLAWIEARQKDDKHVIISLDIEIHKAKNQQIGIVFKQCENVVQVEAVLPNTPALKADLRAGDNLKAIEGKVVTNITQVAKIIKGLTKQVFTLRIERTCPGIIRNDAILEDLELYEDLNEINIAFSKFSDSVQMVGRNQSKMSRKSSLEIGNSSAADSNTPSNSNSPRRVPSSTANRVLTKTASSDTNDSCISDEVVDNVYNLTIPCKKNDSVGASGDDVENFQQHSTIDCPADSFIQMDDLSQFTLDEKCNFLNICVYGKCVGDSVLLGYLNVSINSVLVECCETSVGKFLKMYSLVPPYPHQEMYTDLKTHYLSAQSGFNPELCFGDILVAFVWNGNSVVSPTETPSKKSKSSSTKNVADKSEDDEKADPKNHKFIRTHFHRATQCDFCGKKIWLKDAVQCRECSMCCHKKCVNKCQHSTVCGPVDCSSAATMATSSSSSSGGQKGNTGQPEFTVTEPQLNITTDDEILDECEEAKGKLDIHRQSFSGLIAQGLKRVNSANNLAIPGIGSSLGQSSRSLPPTPQHSPRKQSLVNQSTNPFINVTLNLEILPDNITELTEEQIGNITEPLIGLHNNEDIMSLAKSASKGLYAELPANGRVDKINLLLSKLRIALDSETSSHATLLANNEDKPPLICSPADPKDLFLQTKPPVMALPSSSLASSVVTCTAATGSSGVCGSITILDSSSSSNRSTEHEIAKRAFLLAQSEERVQALSVIMLYLCTGLQHAQGVAYP